MKNIIILSLLFIIFTFSCEKDDITPNETNKNELTSEVNLNLRSQTDLTSRDGFVDLIFYRGSFTTDNFLLFNTNKSNYRIHKIYNKDKIKNIRFSYSGKPDASITGILMSHYNIDIYYKDGTKESLTAYSKKHLNTFAVIPTGDNLLSSTNTTKFVSYETIGSSSANVNSPFYNAFRDETYPLFKWVIKRENVIVSIKELHPIDKISKQFYINHIN